MTTIILQNNANPMQTIQLENLIIIVHDEMRLA